MKTQRPRSPFCCCPLLAGIGCAQVRAKAAFKDGNKLYKEENFSRAIEQYERAIALDPDMAEAYFYLGSSHQALFRPGKEDDGEQAAARAGHRELHEVARGQQRRAPRT